MSKKKKLLFVAIGTVVFLTAVWVGGRISGALTWYSIPTSSNKPTIRPGDQIFASNLVRPKRFDFICFNYQDPFLGKEAVYVFRLCGLPGDTVEIKYGDLFVNGRPVDAQLNLNQEYTFPGTSIQTILELIEFEEEATDAPSTFTKGLGRAALSKQDLEILTRQKIPLQRHIYQPGDQNEGILEKYKTSWNTDHFGPIAVPSNHFFVLGDNRHFAGDSRYIGFIPKQDFVGTVLNRH